jgi:beta-galactosidase
LGPLGVAVNKALRRQMKILKDMGCNAIRSSHNMPSFEQLELADEMGFLCFGREF